MAYQNYNRRDVYRRFCGRRVPRLGTYTNEKRGETYKGAWRRGQRSGRGTETFADGSEYDGYFFWISGVDTAS